MKKALMLSMVFAAAGMAAQAAGMGITYRGSLKVEGGESQAKMQKMSAEEKAQMRQMGMNPEAFSGFEFEAKAEAGRYKMVYLTDFGFFGKGSYVLGDASTKKGYFVFPDKKQYWEMNVDQMQGAADNMMKSMKFTFANQKVDVTPLPPKLVEGSLCQGKRVALSFDTSAKVMGFSSKSHTEETTDYYTSDKYDALALFGGHNWQGMGMVTGDKEFDKVVAAKVGFIGFPIQIVSHRVVNGKDEGTTTYTTKDIQLAAMLPGTFDLPAGYTKTEMGVGSMFQNMGKGGSSENQASEGEEGAQQQDQEQDQQPKKKPSFKDLLKGLAK